MLSVAIVVPTWHYFQNPFKLQLLNELYFATVIESRLADENVDVSVVDLRQIRKDHACFEITLLDSYVPPHDVYLYWIAKSADYYEIADVVEYLRNKYPRAKHAAGGTHVDNFPEQCAEVFDAIVLGLGEESFLNIIKDCQNNRIQRTYSSWWRDVNYDDYPFARREYLPESAIINTTLFEKYGGVRGTSAMFSRGCNFKCAYCMYNVPNKIQMRSPASMEAEIRYLKNRYGMEGLNLRDDICIPLAPKVAVDYLEAIGRLEVIWRGQTRVGAPVEIIKLARDSGCVELTVGVESVSQNVLDIISKGQKVKQARSFIETCKSFGIKIKMCLILGLPGKPPDVVDVTRRFIEEVGPDYVNISGFCPVPGSEIFKNQHRYGIKYIDEDWSRHAHLVFRFDDKEHFGLPFEYESKGPWGEAFSRSEIINNIIDLQQYLRQHSMSY